MLNMRFTQIIQLLAALYLAKIIGDIVVTDQYAAVVILFVGALYLLYSSRTQKFYLFSILVFTPLSFPGYFSLPMDKIIELFVPVIFITIVLELMIRREPLFSSKSGIFFAAVGVMCLWSLVHYINNPVLGKLTFGSAYQSSGLRTYYLVLVGVLIFFCSYWFFLYKEFDGRKWLAFMLVLAVILGYWRILGFYNILPLVPFMGGEFKVGSIHLIREGRQLGIGGLRGMAVLVLSTTLSLFYRKKWNYVSFSVLATSIVFVVLGGGRASFLGVAVALAVYVTLVNRKYLLSAIAIIMIVVSASFLFSNMIISKADIDKSKYGRVFQWSGGLDKQGGTRSNNFIYLFDTFMNSPVFGKGIGYVDVAANKEFFEKYPELKGKIKATGVMRGGHGAYISVLGIYGLGGVFFLAVMLFGSMFHAYKIFTRSSVYNDTAQLALFAFMYLIVLSFMSVVAGNGVNNLQMWFIAGMIAGIKARKGEENIKLQ